MPNRIWKVTVPLEGNFIGAFEQIPYQPVHLVEIPQDSTFISAQCREHTKDAPVIDVWFTSSGSPFPVTRKIKVFATNEPMLCAPLRFLNTVTYDMHGRELVFHVYEVGLTEPVAEFGR